MKLNILKKSKIDKCTDAYCRLQFVKRGFHMMCNRRRGVVGVGGGVGEQNIQYYGLDQKTSWYIYIFFLQKIGFDISCKLSHCAWNAKSYCLWKIRKLFQNVCWKFTQHAVHCVVWKPKQRVEQVILVKELVKPSFFVALIIKAECLSCFKDGEFNFMDFCFKWLQEWKGLLFFPFFFFYC